MTDKTRSELADALAASNGYDRMLDAAVAVMLYDGADRSDDRDNTYAQFPRSADNCTEGTYWISAFSGKSLRTAPDYTSDPTLKRIALTALRHPDLQEVGPEEQLAEILWKIHTPEAKDWIWGNDISAHYAEKYRRAARSILSRDAIAATLNRIGGEHG